MTIVVRIRAGYSNTNRHGEVLSEGDIFELRCPTPDNRYSNIEFTTEDFLPILAMHSKRSPFKEESLWIKKPLSITRRVAVYRMSIAGHRYALKLCAEDPAESEFDDEITSHKAFRSASDKCVIDLLCHFTIRRENMSHKIGVSVTKEGIRLDYGSFMALSGPQILKYCYALAKLHKKGYYIIDNKSANNVVDPKTRDVVCIDFDFVIRPGELEDKEHFMVNVYNTYCYVKDVFDTLRMTELDVVKHPELFDWCMVLLWLKQATHKGRVAHFLSTQIGEFVAPFFLSK